VTVNVIVMGRSRYSRGVHVTRSDLTETRWNKAPITSFDGVVNGRKLLSLNGTVESSVTDLLNSVFELVQTKRLKVNCCFKTF
jgi:hypothetical protein